MSDVTLEVRVVDASGSGRVLLNLSALLEGARHDNVVSAALRFTRKLTQADRDACSGAFSVRLLTVGERKIEALKQIRLYTGLPLTDAYDAVNMTPFLLRTTLSARQAVALVQSLKEVGASAEAVQLDRAKADALSPHGGGV